MSRSFPSLTTLVCALTLLAGGCTELTTTPRGELTETNYTAGERELPHVVAPVYEPLRRWMECCHSYVGMQSEAGDLFVKITTGSLLYDSYHRHHWEPGIFYVSKWWSTLYEGIDATNRVIHQIETGHPPIEDSSRRSALAEVRVARAFYYFHLMDNFGSVPIDTTHTDEDLPQKSSRQAVYDFVVRELTVNIPHLSDAADLSTYGRFNRWAAKALLADVYLNAEVYTGTPRWDRVIEVAGDVIDSGKYQLASDYKDNFRRENHRSDEIIFAIPYDEEEQPWNNFHMASLTRVIRYAMGISPGAFEPWGGARAQPQFGLSYDADDRRIDATWIHGTIRGPQGDSLTFYTADVGRIEEAHPNDHKGWRNQKYELYEGVGFNSDVDVPVY